MPYYRGAVKLNPTTIFDAEISGELYRISHKYSDFHLCADTDMARERISDKCDDNEVTRR
jgi:hypothetical protein